ncbi:HlyD family efflux transporter periplasmic adaptor subunit [Maribacter sp. 2-571]|uniref:HlyD family efflux transporter periplasmic adaptor subunit n=1 Tax=Maribacter sp. 2-571 TaxID=3417569 RepID=UPI003D330EB5
MSEKDKLEAIDLRSPDFQDILSHVPNKIIKWGSGLILGIIAIAIFLTWLIKYPETVSGQAIVTTKQPTIKVVTKISGKIEKLFIKNESKIDEGDYIVKIESQVHIKEINFLDSLLKQVFNLLNGSPASLNLLPHNGFVFGEAQTVYNQLIKSLQDYQEHLEDDYFLEGIKNLESQIANYKYLLQLNSEQIKSSEAEREYARERLEANNKLYDKGVISKMEWFQEKTIFSQKDQNSQITKKDLVQSKITLTEYEKQLAQLKFEKKEKERNLKNQINQNAIQIKNFINSWEQNYVLVSPTDGIINYLDDWTENEFVKGGEPVFAVVPDNQEFLAVLQLSAFGFGKVKVGQKVLVRLDNYPFQEYGELEGKVQSISAVPNQDLYRVEIALAKKMVTRYKKVIKYTPEMTGTAKIITEDLRLIERLLYKFRKIFTTD